MNDDGWTDMDDIREEFDEKARKDAEERRRHPERDYSSTPYRDRTKSNSYDDGDPNENFRP